MDQVSLINALVIAGACSGLTGLAASVMTVNRLKIHLDYLRRDVDSVHNKINAHIENHNQVGGCNVTKLDVIS